MRRILIAECKQEVSTFNPHLSSCADFAIRQGTEILTYHRSIRNEIGGALSVFDQTSDIELIPTYSAFFITSGGTLAETSWHTLAHDFLDAIRRAITTHSIDGIYFCMHGAMASESEMDPEGYLLQETRKIVGDAVPLVVSLDLHGILTNRMLQHSDAIVAYHTYPHVDFFQTGERAARLLLRIMDGHAKPVTAKVAIPALVRGDELITETGRFGEAIRIAQHYEQTPPGLSAGMFIGNPFTDVPALQTYSFVVTDNDEKLASHAALEIAHNFWSHHEHMRVPLVPLAELSTRLLQRIANKRTGTVALVDAADATSSGASGDSNAILKVLLQHAIPLCTLIPIVDAPAVATALRAGIGSTVNVLLGGTLDAARFTPLPVTATVKLLSDGVFQSESFGEHWYAGPTAVLQAGPITLVVSSRAVNLYDRSFFYAHGQNPQRFEAVVVKSPHCQKHMYADWCDEMIMVDAPGSSSANLPYLGHTRCPRPIFPLDADVVFKPQIEVFKRS
jgi:microcystin degradation protein MlrC